MSAVLNDAGTLGYLILLGTVVGVVAAAAFAGLAFTKRRVPLTALVLFPYLVLGFGAFGAIASFSLVEGAMGAATPSTIPVVAMSGAWSSMAVDWLARWGAAVVLAAGVWAAAAGSALVPGDEPKFTFMPAGLAGASAVIGAGIVLSYGLSKGMGSSGMGLALLILVVGAGVAVAATRRAQDDDMFRVAGMRFAASMCALLAIVHAARAVDIGNRMVAFAAQSPLMLATDLPKAVETYGSMVMPGLTIGVVAVLAGIVIAFHGFFSEIGEVVVRYTVFDVFGVVVILLGVGGVRLVEGWSFNSLYRLATNTPAVEMYEELAADLVSSGLTVGEFTVITRYAEGGFGDVLELDDETWHRKFEWAGSNWKERNEELAQVTLDERPPLLAAPRSAPAAKIVEALQATKDGKGFLLLRASEAKAGSEVPAELARLQVTYLPIALSTAQTRHLDKELWVEAGRPEVNYGPVVWFGDGDDAEEPLDYAAAALKGTTSPGLHVLAGERKVGDLVASCLPYLLDQGEEPEEGVAPTLTMNADRWCSVSADTEEVVRAEAEALVPMPAPENVKMALELEGPLDQAEVERLLGRELGALGFCADRAVHPIEGSDLQPEELKGRMTLHLAISKTGDVYDTLVDEKSKVQSPAMLRCATKRYKKMKFTVPEEVPPPPPEPGAKPPEPPVRPQVTVHLDF